jgi:hypothetical protein
VLKEPEKVLRSVVLKVGKLGKTLARWMVERKVERKEMESV